ncbi:uncharacterized protein LOC123402566 [Hordeum vulgare subsp. vulgare]|uniref:uncharacterized protein LOC123402566 n=1 Tax=Hordeum vulgare subsp. vulgare TaxID=112509 RepID=UPI001D1A5002|nr:uncharacterized protein LOC123402566 [Hordeum vulgare subsp. vulgare]KAI4982810.1 hypothetical protein ZWY2020_023302 [Hordeum vulgare]
MANPCTTSRPPCAAPSGTGKPTCLCSPTNHPGSFRCTRHRSPRGRPQPSSSQQYPAASGASATARVDGMVRSGGGGAAGGRTAKGRSVLRAHLLRLVGPPSSGGGDHRRCRDFKPRPSRLGRLAVAA